MAMTRSEIEILIKARNDASATFAALGNDVQKIVQASERGAAAMEKLATKTRESKPAADSANIAFGILASTVATKLGSSFTAAIASANRMDAAMIGLGATAKAFNVDASAANDAARSLAADGLMSVGDAASGLKNLLAAGFGLDEAIVLMNRFRDSAAFGRQGSLEFGQAIVSATEGIKNGNSVLVDNAGVTKNLGQILKEAGRSADELGKASSDAGVRQAIFNGILKETTPQLGQAAIYLETAAGKQAKFNAEIETATANIGRGLQPAYASLLQVVAPLAKAMGDHANVVVPLGIAVAALVAPLAAARAAAALGIPSFTGLAAAIQAASTQALIATGTTGSLRVGLNSLATSAGITTANLGAMGTAVAVAGAAFAGWQVGRLIADLAGLDAAVEDLVTGMSRLRQSRIDAQTGTESELTRLRQALKDAQNRPGPLARADDQLSNLVQRQALEDKIRAIETDPTRLNIIDARNRAIRDGAAATVTYAQAVEFNQRIEAIRVGTFDKSLAAQRASIEAQAALGKITRESANEQLALIKAEEAGLAIRERRITAGAALAAAERTFQAEVAGTGYTVTQLTANLKDNEAKFMLWAKAVGLSDESIKRLKDSLQTSARAHKDHERAQKEAEQQAKQMRDALEQMGLVTLPGVNLRLKDLDDRLQAATAGGVPFANAVRAIWPELQKLAEEAKASGVGLDIVRDRMKALQDQTPMLKPTMSMVGFARVIPVVDQGLGAVFDAMRDQETQVRKTTAAYESFGLKAPGTLKAAADAARENYRILVESGTASTDQLKIAYQKMIDAQKDATAQLPSVWSSMVPQIASAIGTLSTAINGTFAQMLIGAKGFKDGFVDIWESIKRSVVNILNSILSSFLNAFLRGITNALAGQSGAWAQAFSGLTNSAQASLTQQAAGLGQQATGVGTAGGVGTSSLMTNPAFLGTAAGAGAGAFVGWKVGRATGSTAKGAAAGAATGFGVGMVAGPVGGAIGAGVGALAGWLGARKANKEADKEMGAIREKLVATFGDMEKLRAAAQLVGVNIDQAFAQKGVKGVESFNAAIGAFEKKWNELDAAAQRYGVTLDELQGKAPVDAFQASVDQLIKDYGTLTTNGLNTETTLKKMAPAFNTLLMTALDTGKKLPASMEPMLQQMLKLGLITDDVKRRLLGLTDGVKVDFQAMQDKAQQYGIDLGSLGPKFQSARLGEMAQTIMADFNMLTQAGADVGGVLFGMKEEISDLVNQSIKFGTTIPENMRPLIEELHRAGLLVDENGNKIEDLGKIKFAEPLEAGFDRVVEAIRELTGVIAGELPNAVGRGIDEADNRLRGWKPPKVPPIRVPVEIEMPEGKQPWDEDYPGRPPGWWDPSQGPGGARGRPEETPRAARGVMVSGRGPGDLVLFGEGGEPEVGGPKDFFRKVFGDLGIGDGGLYRGGSKGDPISINLTVNLDGRPVQRSVINAVARNDDGARTKLRGLLGLPVTAGG